MLGVNGAGKTTTIKMLSCLTSPTSGEAFLDGKSIASQPGEVKRIIGVSPQETGSCAEPDGYGKPRAYVRRARAFKG